MKYKVVVGLILRDFENEVNKLIKDGWEPLGGMSCSASHGFGETSTTYTQAMVLGGKE